MRRHAAAPTIPMQHVSRAMHLQVQPRVGARVWDFDFGHGVRRGHHSTALVRRKRRNAGDLRPKPGAGAWQRREGHELAVLGRQHGRANGDGGGRVRAAADFQKAGDGALQAAQQPGLHGGVWQPRPGPVVRAQQADVEFRHTGRPPCGRFEARVCCRSGARLSGAGAARAARAAPTFRRRQRRRDEALGPRPLAGLAPHGVSVGERVHPGRVRMHHVEGKVRLSAAVPTQRGLDPSVEGLYPNHAARAMLSASIACCD